MRRVLAAPTLGERGGGIAQVSRLLEAAMRETWPGECATLTLTRGGRARPDLWDKVRFGSILTGDQALGRTRWILFTHLGLMRSIRGMPRVLRAPYAVFLHGLECWFQLPAADRRMLRGAALRMANSRYTAERTMAANPDIGDVIACPLALPVSSVVAPDASWRDAADRPIAIVVGRMDAAERYKGHDQLIDVWPMISARLPGAQLVIIGEGDDRARLEARARPLGAGIRFTGFVSQQELEEWYRRATLFALPSRGEGFGLVYLEAMAHGLPCIGSVHDAAREVIVDGTTGVLVDPDDRAALAEAVARLLEDRDLSRRLGHAGFERVVAEFTFDGFRGRVTRLLDTAFDARCRVPELGRRTS